MLAILLFVFVLAGLVYGFLHACFKGLPLVAHRTLRVLGAFLTLVIVPLLGLTLYEFANERGYDQTQMALVVLSMIGYFSLGWIVTHRVALRSFPSFGVRR